MAILVLGLCIRLATALGPSRDLNNLKEILFSLKETEPASAYALTSTSIGGFVVKFAASALVVALCVSVAPISNSFAAVGSTQATAGDGWKGHDVIEKKKKKKKKKPAPAPADPIERSASAE